MPAEIGLLEAALSVAHCQKSGEGRSSVVPAIVRQVGRIQRPTTAPCPTTATGAPAAESGTGVRRTSEGRQQPLCWVAMGSGAAGWR